MKKQSVRADKVFDFVEIAFAYYKQTAITSLKYYLYYACITQLPHAWQALRKKPYIRYPKILQIYYTQLLNNFENSAWKQVY